MQYIYIYIYHTSFTHGIFVGCLVCYINVHICIKNMYYFHHEEHSDECPCI